MRTVVTLSSCRPPQTFLLSSEDMSDWAGVLRLGALTIDASTNRLTSVPIYGATQGSTITSPNKPAGCTLNSADRTITFATAGSFTFNLVETLAGFDNSPRTSSVTINVVNSGPTLADLSIAPVVAVGTIQIGGATNGSTLTAVGSLPSGMTLNSDTRTLTTNNLGQYTVTLRETLDAATNSPHETTISFTVANVLGTIGIGANVAFGVAVPLTGATVGSALTSPDITSVGGTLNSLNRTVTFSSGGAKSFTIVETLAGRANSPKSNSLTTTVASQPPALGTLTIPSSGYAGTPLSIGGFTNGSTITVQGNPSGVTIDNTAHTITFDTAGAKSVTLIETFAGATGSPKSTTVTTTISNAIYVDPTNVLYDPDTNTYTFTIRRGGPTPATNVNWAVTASTLAGRAGVNEADFGGTFPSGTVHFNSGQTSTTITVTPTSNATPE